MRLVIDTMIALMLAGVLAAVLYHHRQNAVQWDQVQAVHQSLAKLHEQAMYHGALGDVPTGNTGFPRQVSPLWFDGEVPLNPLAPGWCRWIDLAPEGDMQDHPPDPVAERPEQAGFWYNPNRGIFRARVRRLFTEQETLALYNTVNTTTLAALPLSQEPARQPQEMAWPAATPAPAAPAAPAGPPVSTTEVGKVKVHAPGERPKPPATAPAPTPPPTSPATPAAADTPARRPSLRDLSPRKKPGA